MAEPVHIAEFCYIFSSLRRGYSFISSCLTLDGFNSMVFRFTDGCMVYNAEISVEMSEPVFATVFSLKL